MRQCHTTKQAVRKDPARKRVVLAGNPNCGKSVLFNTITGMYVDVSNFPGTTVDLSTGRLGKDMLIDTPGVYGISSFNDEERVTRDVAVDADIIINVVNAMYLERDLFLTLQVMDLGIPMIVVLNMMDEVNRNNITIDINRLSELLGLPVVPTVAVTGEGVDDLRKSIKLAAVSDKSPELAQLMEEHPEIPIRREALLFFEDDPEIAAKYGTATPGTQEIMYLARRKRVNDIIAQVVSPGREDKQLSHRLSSLLLTPLTGFPILAGILYLMYRILGVWIAQDLVYYSEEVIMQGKWEPFITGLVERYIPPTTAVYQILAGEFGVLTMTVTYVFGLLLPLVLGFYLLLSLLEDTGYLPRIAALLDSSLTKLGLNGRAIIPLILGFGCVTMASMTTRLLGSSRERTIALALLGITIPCSAQLGVIAAMVAPLGPKLALIYVAVIFAVFVAVGTILNRLLPGRSTDLLMDIPPLRLPRLANVLQKSWTKTYHFLTEAGPLFAVGAVLLSVLQITGALVALQEVVAPLTEGLLHLPKETANAFIMGFVRRDFGAAGLYSMDLTDLQTLVALIVITLFVPCIASSLVLVKERGFKEGALIWLGAIITAFVAGGAVSNLIF